MRDIAEEYYEGKGDVSREEMQAWLASTWEFMTLEDREMAIAEGFTDPTKHVCTVIVVDFMCGLGEIGRYTV